MGTGIDAARAAGAGVHADAMENFRDQLLIVCMKRLRDKYGDGLEFPLVEVDDTGQDLLSFSIDPVTKAFHFELGKKS
jgi:hypothetical protein